MCTRNFYLEKETKKYRTASAEAGAIACRSILDVASDEVAKMMKLRAWKKIESTESQDPEVIERETSIYISEQLDRLLSLTHKKFIQRNEFIEQRKTRESYFRLYLLLNVCALNTYSHRRPVV